MGSGNSVPETQVCCDCVKTIHIHVDNPCGIKLCLQCYWKHFKNCFGCQRHVHEDPTKNELLSALKHLQVEFNELKADNLNAQGNYNSANERYHRELNFRLKKENELTFAQESINGQKKQLATLRDRVNILERENANWKVEVAKTKSFLVNSEKQIARFRKLVEDRDVVITKQNKELREVNPEKNPVAGQLNQQLADCRRLVKDKDVLISKLNEQLEDINELHVRFEHLETENRQLQMKVQQLEADRTFDLSKHHLSTWRRYFMQMSVDDLNMGRVVIETYPECAPNVCQLFHKLMNGVEGIYLLNRITTLEAGGYMVIPEAKTKSGDSLPLYAADYNDLEVKRGAVAMRVQSFAPNDVHLIGSQFSIAVGSAKDPLVSHVFGYVVEGLTVCDAICRLDPSQHRIVVADCGEMEPKMMESLTN